MHDPAQKYFNCTERDRAVFEAGIKLGTLYHQYVGVPLNLSNVDALERAMEGSLRVQPFVTDARVRIDRESIHKRQGVYKYITLYGEMLDVQVEVTYGSVRVRARLRYVEDMDYPLMYVEDVREG
ncbi:dihydroneopterin aldolase family protein [Thermogymnomonas acidicola]|nr:dihydroneopterin aldolase family protein [Thermogymnomonas acidicola]